MKGREHLVTGAKHHHLAFSEHQKFVGLGQNARAVGDHQDTRALGLEAGQGFHERLFPSLIQIGVGLVQDHQFGVAVNGARQGHALALTARQDRALFTNAGLQSLRECVGHLAQSHLINHALHLLHVHLAKARDVLGQGAVKELHRLGQIAQVWAQFVFVPIEHIGTVEPHLALQGWPQTHDQASECRLARGRGTDDHHRLARCDRKTHSPQNRNLTHRCTGNDALDRQHPFGGRKRHRLTFWRKETEQIFQALVGVAGVDHEPPLRHQLRERLQHFAPQNRGHHHHAAAAEHLALDGEPASRPQEQRALQGLDQLGDGVVGTGRVRRVGLELQEFALLDHPFGVDVAHHAHGLNHLGVSEGAVGVVLRIDGASVGFGQDRHGFLFGVVGNVDLHHGAEHGHDTEPGAHNEDDDQKHQGHGRIEHGHDGARGQEFTQGFEVIEALDGAAGDALDIGLKSDVKEAAPEVAIKVQGELLKEVVAHELQELHHDVAADHQDGEHDEGDHASGVDHAVIDLKHVDGGCQRERADHQTVEDGTPIGIDLFAKVFGHHFGGPRAGRVGVHEDAPFKVLTWA